MTTEPRTPIVSLDDLELDIASAHDGAIVLTRWMSDARRSQQSAPSPTIASWVGRAIEEAQDAWTEADARESALMVQMYPLWEQIREAARWLAKLAREGLPIDNGDEDKLLALLGTHELSADGLDPADHAYVVASLRAREAARENDEAFAAFVKARQVLLNEEREQRGVEAFNKANPAPPSPKETT